MGFEKPQFRKQESKEQSKNKKEEEEEKEKKKKKETTKEKPKDIVQQRLEKIEKDKRLDYLKKISELLNVKVEEKLDLKEEDILKKLRAEYSDEVIDKALNYQEKKEALENIYKEALTKIKTEKKNVEEIFFYLQTEKGVIEYKLTELQNFYLPALIDLKLALLEDKKNKLKKQIDKELAHLTEKEKKEDLKKKLKEYEIKILASLVLNEYREFQDKRLEIQCALNRVNATTFRKVLDWYNKLPRPIRAAIGAGITGFFVAGFGIGMAPVSLISAAGLSYIGFRMARGLVGGGIGAFLQSMINPFIKGWIDRSYKKQLAKEAEETEKILRGEKELIQKEEKKVETVSGQPQKLSLLERLKLLFGKEEKVEKGKKEKQKKQPEQKAEKVIETQKEKPEESEEERFLRELNEELKNLDKYFEDLISRNKEKAQEALRKIGEFNLKLAQARYQRIQEIRNRLDKRSRRSYLISALITGAIGGTAGYVLTNYIADSLIGGATGYPVIEKKYVTTETPPSSGTKTVEQPTKPETPPDTTTSKFQQPSEPPKTQIDKQPTKPETPSYPGTTPEQPPSGPSKPTIETIEKYISSKEILDKATIGKGEGIEHALIRQLKSNPTLFGFKGDVNDLKAVEAWAEKYAHELAIKNGFVDPKTGVETRVFWFKDHKIAYLLQPDGTIKTYVDGQEFISKDRFFEYEYKPPKEVEVEQKHPQEPGSPYSREMRYDMLEYVRRKYSQTPPTPETTPESLLLQPTEYGEHGPFPIDYNTVNNYLTDWETQAKVFSDQMKRGDLSLADLEDLRNTVQEKWGSIIRESKSIISQNPDLITKVGNINEFWGYLNLKIEELNKLFEEFISNDLPKNFSLSQKETVSFLNLKIEDLTNPDKYQGLIKNPNYEFLTRNNIVRFIEDVVKPNLKGEEKKTVAEFLKNFFFEGKFKGFVK